MYLKRKTGIIFALDFLERDQALDIVKALCHDIDSIKIGLPILLRTSFDIVRNVKSICALPIIADLKVCDVPYISRNVVRMALQSGCDGVIVHGFMGPDSVEACIKEGKEGMIFVATELTSVGGQVFMQPVADDIARMALELGAYGIQAPGTRPDRVRRLREIVTERLVIISCGIGAQGPRPGSAIEAGADFEIIGRAIYEAPNPLESIKNIRDLIQKAMRGTA